MAQEIVQGKIIQFNEDGTVIITSVVPNIERAILRQYKNVSIGFNDGRSISVIQRRKIYALIGEIADYVGSDIETQKRTMKMDFVLNHLQAMERKIFSLSDVSMSIAKEFISYLIDFIIAEDIPS